MINYLELSKEQINEIQASSEDKLPHLLLHVCCGACSCFPLVYLANRFEIDVFYNNSNIAPYEEFIKRKEALNDFLVNYEKKLNKKVRYHESSYEYERIRKILYKFKDSEEKGERCKLCINLRIEELFKKAEELKIPYVSTVMSYSKNKDSDFINALGLKLEKKYPKVKFLVFDFKKNNGQEYGNLLTKKYKIYRQNYCGCEFAKRGLVDGQSD